MARIKDSGRNRRRGHGESVCLGTLECLPIDLHSVWIRNVEAEGRVARIFNSTYKKFKNNVYRLIFISSLALCLYY